MAKEPITIVNTDGTMDKAKAQEIAREIMQDIDATKAKVAEQLETKE